MSDIVVSEVFIEPLPSKHYSTDLSVDVVVDGETYTMSISIFGYAPNASYREKARGWMPDWEMDHTESEAHIYLAHKIAGVLQELRSDAEKEARVSDWFSKHTKRDLADHIEAQAAEIERLRGELAKAVEALRFYAWENEKRLPSEGPWGAGSTDFGTVARATLAELTGGKWEVNETAR